MSYIVPREKPKCYNCPFRTLDYCGLLIEHDCVTVNVNEMTVSKYCPLVEIPTPHGRLVDADKLMMSLADWWYSSFGEEETDEAKAIRKVLDKIEQSLDEVAIIEAEGSEE